MQPQEEGAARSGILAQGKGRRNLLRTAAVVVGAGALTAGCTSNGTTANAGGSTSDSLLTRVKKAGKIRFGVDLTFPPIQFKDPKNGNKPSGYCIDLANMLAKDLGVTAEFVEIPFAEIFAAQTAGKFDMSGIAATILPSRAEKVLFASQPLFIESEVILLKPGLKINSPADLNTPDTTLAVLTGSSQEATAPLLFPKAKTKSLDNQAAIQDVASGRSTATLLSEFNIVQALQQHPELSLFNGPPVFADINSFFMPAGDFTMKAYIDNWLSYQTTHGVLSSLWDKFVANDAHAHGVPSVGVTSPYIKG